MYAATTFFTSPSPHPLLLYTKDKRTIASLLTKTALAALHHSEEILPTTQNLNNQRERERVHNHPNKERISSSSLIEEKKKKGEKKETTIMISTKKK